MKYQNFEKIDIKIRDQFKEFSNSNIIKNRLKLFWINWGFGLEPIEKSLERLDKFHVRYIELHGNKYGIDLGYAVKNIKRILKDFNIKVSGICGMAWKESELASTSPFIRQRCIDYLRRNIEMCQELSGEYILCTPAAIGRPQKYDDFEFDRAVETLKILGDDFEKAGVKAAIEPVRVDEVSFCHTFKDALDLLNSVNHKGIRHIAGDVYHMLHQETHIEGTILDYEDYLVNLHMADTNRKALKSGMLNIDIIIMALYLVGYNNKNAYLSAEPLGPSADPYYQMYSKTNPDILDKLVSDSAKYFYEREKIILEGKVDNQFSALQN